MKVFESENRVRKVNKLLEGLDTSLQKTYIHADVLKVHFPDSNISGVFSICLDMSDKVYKFNFLGPKPENHLLIYDTSNNTIDNVLSFIKYIAVNTNTNTIIQLDGNCVATADLLTMWG